MYRDSANALDEHDRAVGAILISEVLLDECEKARAIVHEVQTERNERWRTITGVHDTYPEVWRHLDRARKELAGRGANTASYDEHRPQAPRAATNAEGTDIELAAIDDARRAVEELKLAVPGADWIAIKKRTAGLLRVPLDRPRGQRATIVVLLSLFVIAIITWSISIIPARKEDPRQVMRRELTEVSNLRKAKITTLRFGLGLNCNVAKARELTKLLAFDGRWSEAASFGQSYIARCGDDSVVDNWANAPVPKRF
jgi:hypothetical protein